MKYKVFIDESGNTGDVRNHLSFSDQPHFVLAGVGIPEQDLSHVSEFIEELRKKYRIQSSELKSKNLYSSKPNLVVEVFEYLFSNNYPVFVELNDKKFLHCTQITNIIMNTILDPEPNEAVLFSINHCADYLYNNLPKIIYSKFTSACELRDETSFEEFFYELDTFLRKRTDPYGKTLVTALESAISEYEQLKVIGHETRPMYECFLPSPDIGKKGQTISSLPNISALATILGRAEQYRIHSHLEPLHFIHDQQDHYFEILEENMEHLREDLSTFSANNHLEGIVHYNLPDFLLTEGDSKKESGLQIADIIAGTVFQIWKEMIRNRFKLASTKYTKVFQTLVIEYPKVSKTFGVNFVVPTEQFNGCFRSLSGKKVPQIR